MNIILKKELLRIINERDDFDSILSKHITYPQISEELINLANERFIENTPDGFKLTEKGSGFMNSKTDFEKFEELKEYKTEIKIRVDEFYLPKYIKGVIKELKN